MTLQTVKPRSSVVQYYTDCGYRNHPKGTAKLKIIFLDINGVIAQYGGFDGDATKVVRDVIKQTGAMIVLTSSERAWLNAARVKEFTDHDLWGYVIDATPEIHRADRYIEIMHWIVTNRSLVDTFVIVDDHEDACIPNNSDSFVHVTGSPASIINGSALLNADHGKRMIDILNAVE